MSTARFRFRPLAVGEAADAARRMQASFGSTGDLEQLVSRFEERAAEGLVWVLADAATHAALGQCVLKPNAHWFGGREVACQHIGGVGVAPEHRGTGVASALMRAAVRHGAGQQLGLSLLFPAANALYRKLGWEQAGTYIRWRLPARFAPQAGTPLRPLSDADWPAVQACQERWAAALNGPEVRDEPRWRSLREQVQFAYGLDAQSRDGLEAYVLVAHEAIPEHWQHTLRIVDWAAETGRGLAGVVGFVGSHGTLARDATFHAPAPNPWALLLAEQDLVRDRDFDWMARPLHLPRAVGARGYPEGLRVATTFAVDDPMLPDNHGPWRLEVADGHGRLEPAARAEARVDVTALGPLLTGYRTAGDLARAGRLAGPAATLRALDAAFGGAVPTLLDFF